MASNLRRTDDLQRLRARELVLQNADGSFPTQGQVMIAGNDGRVEFTPVFSLDTSGNMMVPGNIYVGGDVVATGLYVNGPFSVNISHIIAGDLSAGSAVIGTLDASAATMTDLTVDRVHVLDYIDDANQITSLNTNLVRAVQVLAGSENPNDQPTVGTALDVSGAALVRAGLTVAGVLSVSGGLDTSGNLGVGGALMVDGSANIARHLAVDGSANVFGRLYVGGDGLDDRGLITVEDASGTAFKMRNLAAQGELFVADAGSENTQTPILQCDATTNSFNIYDSSRSTLLAHVDASGIRVVPLLNVGGHLDVDGSANVFGRLYVGGDGLDDRGLISVSDNSDSLFKFRNKGHVGAIFNTLESTGAITTPTLLFDGSENEVRLVSTDASAHPILVADGTSVDVGGVFSVAPQFGVDIGQLLVEDVCGTHLKLDQAGSIGRILETDVATGTPQTPFLEFNGPDGTLNIKLPGDAVAVQVDSSGDLHAYGNIDISGDLTVAGGINGIRTVKYVACGQGGATIQWSYDGLNWFPATSGAFSIQGYAAAYNGSYWIAVGEDASGLLGSIKLSYNGKDWLPIQSGGFSYGLSVAWNGAMWVAGGGDGTLSIPTLQWSIDGLQWFPATSGGFSIEGYGLTWNGTFWIATGRDGLPANLIQSSYDGKNWQSVQYADGPFNNDGFDVATDGENHVAVGRFDFKWSRGGGIWQSTNHSGSDVFSGIAFNGSRWVAVGYQRILYSDDILNWISSSSGGFGTSEFGNDIVWDGEKWLAAGSSTSGSTNTLRYSYDGNVWNPISIGGFTIRGNGIGVANVAQGNAPASMGKSSWPVAAQDSLVYYHGAPDPALATPRKLITEAGTITASDGATVVQTYTKLSDSTIYSKYPAPGAIAGFLWTPTGVSLTAPNPGTASVNWMANGLV